MKAAQERNQECLPPKKRDLPVSNSSSSSSSGGAGVTAGPERGGGGGGGVGGSGGGTTGGTSTSTVGDDEAVSIQTSAASGDAQGGAAPAEWVRAQPGLHYSVDGAEGVPAVPIDQYSMLYKVALPSVTYSPNSPHPVLSHISSAYTVHSPLLQHPGLPYPPLGYAQIPHSSVQFVSPPYAAMPYALPPGFVPGSLISPSGAISQPHAVSHLVPYPPVIQEGVVSPPPQPQVAAHTFAKVGASAGAIPLMLPSEQAAQQHLGAVGVLSAKEGLPVYYQAQGARAAVGARDPHGGQQENEPEVNGGDKAQGTRELALDSAYVGKNVRQLQATQEHSQDRGPHNRWLDGRSSPGRPGTPDSDLEVQQVVGRLASSHQAATGGRKEVSFAAPGPPPQSTGRSRELHAEGVIASRPAYAGQAAGYSDPRAAAGLQQQAVVLANGQPLLVPLDHPTQQQQQQQQQYAGLTNDARVCLPEKEAQPPQQQQQPPGNPSHFMKGAIIQLATGELKRVEDLQTQDFVRSAEASGGLKIDSSMVVDVRPSRQRAGLVSLHFTVGEQQSRVAIDVPPEHPFFVFGQGWSSCSPERTAQLYGLACHHLQAGDVCVSVTLQQPPQQQQQQLQPQQQQQQQLLPRTLVKSSVTSAPIHQLMGPPAPQQPRPQSLSHPRPERSPRERVDRDGGDKDAALHLGPLGLGESPAGRTGRTAAEHPRSQSSYHLHTHTAALEGAGSVSGTQRRWSSPGLQRYDAKGEEVPRGSMSSSAHRRPSFIPQEVKLSIEGRSNAGK